MNTNQSDETEEKSLSCKLKEEHDRVNSDIQKNIEETRMRLAKEVEELKRREAAGDRVPSDAMQRILESRNAQDNIICIADVFKEVAKDWEEKSKKVQEFSANLWRKVEKVHFKECTTHKSLIIVNKDATFSASWKERKVRIVYEPCDKCEQKKKDSLVNEKWKKIGIPDRLLDKTLENFLVQENQPKRNALNKTTAATGFVIIRGTVGTGKSHLAVGLIKKEGEGIFVTEADLIGELRQTYADKTGQNSMIDKYRKTKVLVLDELSKEVHGIDIPSFLYKIFSYRHDKDLLSVITSNESLEDIEVILGEKLWDRIRDNNTVVTCEWESYRGKK